MDIEIIGVPTFYGCDNPGTELGPDKFRERNVVSLLKNKGHNVVDLGDITVPKVNTNDKFKTSNEIKYLDPLIKVNNKLAHKVHSSIGKGKFPLIIGGDHSISIGSIAGISEVHKNIGVIWIDAHGDINTHSTSNSKNMHGMPLAASMNVGHELLTNLYNNGMKVNPSNVFHLGGRDFDEGENKLIESLDINVYTNKDIRKFGLDNCIDNICNEIKNKGLDNIHLSFDIDFIDSEFVPGTGTRVKEGFTVEETKYMLSKIFKSLNIVSMDIVELNPKLDIEDSTANIAIDIINEVF